MSIAQSFLTELEQESPMTRKSLERVPQGRLDFKPHEKSMTMGDLAVHIAESIGWGVVVLEQDVFDLDPESYAPPKLKDPKEIVALFDKHEAALKQALAGRKDEHMLATWKMTMKGETVMEMPRASVFRSMILNHTVHHRAQLGVYLRLNNVPVPAVYGPSADESPM
ncbi:MAG: DinB family protein [Acidobacteriota bacterium]